MRLAEHRLHMRRGECCCCRTNFQFVLPAPSVDEWEMCPPNDTAQQPAHAGETAEARETVLRVAGLLQRFIRPYFTQTRPRDPVPPPRRGPPPGSRSAPPRCWGGGGS